MRSRKLASSEEVDCGRAAKGVTAASEIARERYIFALPATALRGPLQARSGPTLRSSAVAIRQDQSGRPASGLISVASPTAAARRKTGLPVRRSASSAVGRSG